MPTISWQWNANCVPLTPCWTQWCVWNLPGLHQKWCRYGWMSFTKPHTHTRTHIIFWYCGEVQCFITALHYCWFGFINFNGNVLFCQKGIPITTISSNTLSWFGFTGSWRVCACVRVCVCTCTKEPVPSSPSYLLFTRCQVPFLFTILWTNKATMFTLCVL